MKIAETWIKRDWGAGRPSWRRGTWHKGKGEPRFALRTMGRRWKRAELAGGLGRYMRGDESPYSYQPQSK